MKFLMPRGQQSSPKERTVWDYLAKFFRNPELGATQVTSVTVADQFVANATFLWQELTPAGVADCDVTGTLADWVLFGNIAVPTWATKVRVNLMMHGIFPVTAATGVYNYRVRVGANNGRTVAFASPTALNMRVAFQLTDQITLASTGSLAFALQMTRTGGAGAMRLDTACDFTAELMFVP